MSKGFNAGEAKRAYKTCKGYLEQLNSYNYLLADREANIRACADYVVIAAAMETLKNVPVEEINRGDTRLRVSALREAGFTNMAEIFGASAQNLSDIYGISEDSGKLIKKIAEDRFSLVKGQTKLKLSADGKTSETTALVMAISSYRRLCALSETVSYVLNTYEEQLGFAFEDITPALNGFKLFFTGKDKKATAEKAYNYLVLLLGGEFGEKCGYTVNEISALSNIQPREAWRDFQDNTADFFGIIEALEPGLLGNTDTKYGLPEELAGDIAGENILSEGLLCRLRNYQLWGVKYILHQGNVLLGDEMGLGKTVQAIGAMVSLRNMGATHFVVVCPAGVLSNWIREISKHSNLFPVKIHGEDKETAWQQWVLQGGVAVTTYETTAHLKLEESFQFAMLVVDEAHYIKNPAAKRTKNTVALSKHAERLLFMTGTAIENNVEEMLSLIRILQPKVAAMVKDYAFMSSAPEFREKISPVYYRRKREDVLTELPELIQIQDWCEMSIAEEAVYEKNILSGASYGEIRRVSWNMKDLSHSSKAARLKEIVEEAKLEDRKVIVFSFFLDTIDKITGYLGREICMEPITGSVKPQRRQEIIDEFDKAASGSVLVSQIQSGGTGLNIQSASVVVICEPQFKPSIENQAISRAYRMGQARNVIVHRLLCEDTVDEKLIELLAGKQDIFNAFADTSVAGDRDLSWNDNITEDVDEATFGRIVKEEYERISAKCK